MLTPVLWIENIESKKSKFSKTGGAKYSQVISDLYGKLPLVLRLFFTQTELDKYIEDSVTWLKNKLQDPNVTLLSYAEKSIVKATEAASTASSIETIVITPVKKYVTEDGTELAPVIVIDPLAVAAQ